MNDIVLVTVEGETFRKAVEERIAVLEVEAAAELHRIQGELRVTARGVFTFVEDELNKSFWRMKRRIAQLKSLPPYPDGPIQISLDLAHELGLV